MASNWYVVHTYSGYEDKVKAVIGDKAQRRGLSGKISQILIPTGKVVELKSGKKKESTKKFYPGYILINLELDDETWALVNSTPRVTGFVGGENPVPLLQEEIDDIKQQIEKGPAAQVKAQFNRGETGGIMNGAFSNFNGYVDEGDSDD